MLAEGGRHFGFRTQLPGGPGDLTLAELQEMATRQQQQMEAQQQVLVAKEQRLKFLKQQEARHAQLASESERLRRIRERVESQELKLKKLRALRGQAEQYRSTNGQLNGELNAVRAVFNEKEKELATAVARVDQLTRQLQDLRSGKINTGLSGQKHAAAAIELEKLRKELLLRNQLNEQQASNAAAKEKVLQQKQEEVKTVDNKIHELQQRLKRRKLLEDQKAQKQAANAQNKQAKENSNTNYANTNTSVAYRAGDPYIVSRNAIVKDDLYSSQPNSHFAKQDLRYQTLPPGARFTQPTQDGNGSKYAPHADATDRKDGSAVEQKQLPAVLPPSANQKGQNLSASQKPLEPRHHPPDRGAIIPPLNKPQKFNNNDFSKPNQNFSNVPPPPVTHPKPQLPPPQPPVPAQRHTTVKSSAGLDQPKPPVPTNKFFPPPVVTPRVLSISHDNKDVTENQARGAIMQPIINIQEERQAGSGQSSPASSEGSSASSGGIQIKDNESLVNEAPLGPVSAMIKKLNTGGGATVPASREDAKPSTQLVPSSSSIASHAPLPGAKTTMAAQHDHAKMLPNGFSSISTSSISRPQPSHLKPSGHQDLAGPAVQSDESGSPQDGSDSSQASTTQTSVARPHPVPSSQQGPHLNLKPAPTYRYASKNQIANTYMGRLGGAAMEKYQQNLNKLYKNMETHRPKADPSAAVSVDTATTMTTTSPAETAGQEPNSQTAFGSVSPHDYPDIASDKGSYKLNTPKQVRRRHSDGESEDVNKALQDRQEVKGSESQHPSQDKTDSEPPPSDVSKDNHHSQKLTSGAEPKPSEQPSHKTPPSNVTSTPTPLPSSSASSSLPTSSALSSFSSSSPSSSSSSSSSSAVIPSSTSSTTSPPTTAATTTSQSQSKPVPSTQDTSTAKPGKPEVVTRRGKSNLKKNRGTRRSNNRVSFDPLALLLDGSLEGELDLVKKVAVQVDDVSTPNDEGITALHNAICAGHYEIVKFLIEFGCDVNSPDSDGWTPLHCAASCNNLPMVRFLVEHGACVFATTISDQETAADKCEEDEDGYDSCSDYLYSIQEKLGIASNGEVYAVFDYTASNADELSFEISDKLTVLQKGDDTEKEWWWASLNGEKGYIPRNLLGLFPRVIQQPSEVSEC